MKDPYYLQDLIYLVRRASKVGVLLVRVVVRGTSWNTPRLLWIVALLGVRRVFLLATAVFLVMVEHMFRRIWMIRPLVGATVGPLPVLVVVSGKVGHTSR